MRRHFIKKLITSIIFVSLLLGFSMINSIHAWPKIKKVMINQLGNQAPISRWFGQLEETIEENLLGRYGFRELYGYWHLVLGKNEINHFSYIKDEKGCLHDGGFSDEVDKAESDYDYIIVSLYPSNLKKDRFRFFLIMSNH